MPNQQQAGANTRHLLQAVPLAAGDGGGQGGQSSCRAGAAPQEARLGWGGGCWGLCPALPSPALPYLAHEVLASLPLQMMLYFNACYFPFWCLGEGMMLQLKVLSGGQVRGGELTGQV